MKVIPEMHHIYTNVFISGQYTNLGNRFVGVNANARLGYNNERLHSLMFHSKYAKTLHVHIFLT